MVHLFIHRIKGCKQQDDGGSSNNNNVYNFFSN